MAELIPYPFPRLITRMLRELDRHDRIFDLPRKKWFLGDESHDTSVRFHGRAASTPLGPAAGPHSQMAQNLVLAWLAGSRIMELKTVQIMDELTIPRPCIDIRTIGYNIEWSQELKLEQSLDEYVKGSMLIEMLSRTLDLAPGFCDLIFDMSVGYDLEGIKSDRVRAFIDGMMDASAVVERLRAEIPAEFGHLRDLEYRTKLSDTLTLSTFHGCPPDEIERIIDYLLREVGLNCVIKLNPTLLGPDRVRSLLHDQMGYTNVRVPDSAFEKDTKWEQAEGFIERLCDTAQGLGLGLGVKFSNTLLVEHDGEYLPKGEKEKYLSGPPLHVLAMSLVAQLRERFGDTVPISFSAGIEKSNFPDAVALGLTPITVCTDLLKTGGYGRASAYFPELFRRMDAVGASSVDEFILKAYGNENEANSMGDGSTGVDAVSNAKLLNTRTYVAKATKNDRFAIINNSKPPKKMGTMLELFNCITCDKCVPVCPNDANFTITLPPRDVPVEVLLPKDGGFEVRAGEPIVLDKKHQIANFSDFCNECGNCDVFCPEDGGPYILKPRFFGSLAAFEEFRTHDGFLIEHGGGTQRVRARFGEAIVTLVVEDERATYAGEGFEISFDRSDPAGTASGQASGEVDLTYYHIMELMREAVMDTDDVNFVNA